MFKAIDYLITMRRTKAIIEHLKKYHNLDISEDARTIRTVMLMVKITSFTNKQILEETLDMFVWNGDLEHYLA